MTATLLLRLDGPMQAWSVAEFGDRPTMPFPTKSGIVGLLANAHGRTRGDAVEDLAGLTTAVRADDAGRPMTDFQTAGRDGWRSADGRLHTDTYKTRRKGYLLDAVFTVALTGDDGVINRSADAIRRPARPLFLGRRCCPPATPILIGVTTAAAGLEARAGLEVRAGLEARTGLGAQASLAALRDVPYQGHKPVPPERFMVAMDAEEGEVWDDHPVSYLGDRREHRPRCVIVTEIAYTGRGGDR